MNMSDTLYFISYLVCIFCTIRFFPVLFLVCTKNDKSGELMLELIKIEAYDEIRKERGFKSDEEIDPLYLELIKKKDD